MKTIISAAVLFLLSACNGAGTDQPAASDTSVIASPGNNAGDTMRNSLNADSVNRNAVSDSASLRNRNSVPVKDSGRMDRRDSMK
jgi:hypothetical protein